MSEEAKKARAAMKAKAKRLASASSEKVDSSDWKPSEPINADVKTGMRPVSRRAFRSGGKVEGEAAKAHAGKKPRKSGGKVLANALVNRNDKDANEEREGKKHIGGLKTGGRAKRASGGKLKDWEARALFDKYNASKQAESEQKLREKQKEEKVNQSLTSSSLKTGGRAKKAYGGRGVGERTQTELARREAVQAATDYGMDKANDTANLAAKTKAFEDKKTETGYKKGGRTKKNNGGPMGDPRLGIVKDKAMEFAGNPVTPGLKKGGKVKHDDEAMDKALIKKMVKPAARTGKAAGGDVDDKPKMYLGANKGSASAKAAEKEYGPIEEPLDRAMKRIANDFSPAAMRKMRADRAKRMADDKGLQEFIERKKKRDSDDSMKDAGYKAGGRSKRATGGMIEDTKKALMIKADPHNQSKIKPAEPKKEEAAEKNCGGRMARKSGGRAKGKTNINIVISGAGKDQGPMPGMMPPGGPMGGPPKPPGGVPVPMPAPQQGGAPMPMPMPVPMPPPQQPPMARKSGGRVSKVAKSYKDMEAGAASGEGRLQKTDIAKRTNTAKKEDGEKTFTGKGYPNKVPGANGGRKARKAGGMIKMHAGAGSGEGRLEKTERAKRK